MIARFFHRLFHYHCEECLNEELATKQCKSCEILQFQLSSERKEKELLLARLLDNKSNEEQSLQEPVAMPNRSSFIPFSVKRQMLEEEDRQKAKILKQKQIEIDELEKEVGV